MSETTSQRWLLLIHQLPSKPADFCVKIWQRLQRARKSSKAAARRWSARHGWSMGCRTPSACAFRRCPWWIVRGDRQRGPSAVG